MLPSNSPGNYQEKIGKKWVNVTMMGLQWSTYTGQLWFLEPALSPFIRIRTIFGYPLLPRAMRTLNLLANHPQTLPPSKS